ncbi:MAG: DinB family protein [Vicinamibacterales bacterium]
MDSLTETVATGFIRRFDAFLEQAQTLAATMTDAEFWTRPYPYGNSAGHLLLHVTGNLNYYVGTQIAGTGYVRHRDLEFTDPARRPKADVLRDLTAAVDMVKAAIAAQSAADWSLPYEAKGSDDPDRFSIVLRCTHHFHHHLGQMVYLAKEHAVRRGQ